MNWSRSSLCTLVVHYTVSWQLSTMIWIYKNQIAGCFISLVPLVLWTMFKCASWVILLVAALAVSQWTNWSLQSWYLPMSDIYDKVPIDQLDSDPLLTGWGVCVAMIWWCGIGEEDDNKKKWEVLRNIWSASCQNGLNRSQPVHYTQDESYWAWMKVAGVSTVPQFAMSRSHVVCLVTRMNCGVHQSKSHDCQI